MSGFTCRNTRCGERFKETEAGVKTEYEPTEAFGIVRVIARNCIACPACGGLELEEITCSTCETVLACIEDDLCENCRDLEEQKDYEADLDGIIEERRVRAIRDDLSETMRRIARGLREDV